MGKKRLNAPRRDGKKIESIHFIKNCGTIDEIPSEQLVTCLLIKNMVVSKMSFLHIMATV